MSFDRLKQFLKPGRPATAEPAAAAETVIARVHTAVDINDSAEISQRLEDFRRAAANQDLMAVDMARALAAKGRGDLAESLLSDWLNDNSGLWAGCELAQMLRARGDIESALVRYRAICDAFPDDATPFAAVIEILSGQGRLDEAEAIVAAQLPRFPAHIWLWDAAAQLAAQRGDSRTAFARWRTLRHFAPEHVRAWLGMADILTSHRKRDVTRRLMHGEDIELDVLPVDDLDYRTPGDLQTRPTVFRRGLVIGSCLASGLPKIFGSETPACETDFVLVNNAAGLPEAPPQPVDAYDFQFVQIPLRAILPDGAHFGLAYDDPAAFEQLFEMSCSRISQMLDALLAWNRQHGLLSFVTNFLVPQQNAMGRLMPRYDLRNFVHFIERLNVHLAAELDRFRNVHLVDIDQIAATLGKRFIQDDMVWVTGHASVLSDADFSGDQARLEPLQPVKAYYPTRVEAFASLIWRDVVAQYRTLHQTDSIKMVLIDLDDTLWRGVLAETGHTDTEGWPVGFAEALVFLKRRGIILGIVSKNSEDRIRGMWPFERLLPLESFAIHRINWQPKAENIAEILAEVNLLPHSVLFIDDNPTERAAVQGAFPDMRVLGANPYLWRRILLWSAETQVATVTAESARRTEMIQAQGERELSRRTLSREAFLASLNIEIAVTPVTAVDDPAFTRAFELLNKTNQFNTNGRRWTHAEAEAFLARGGIFYTLRVADIHTSYGLVGVLCVAGAEVLQFVMSCRVLGLDVEIALVAEVMARMPTGEMRASIVETEANAPSRDIWTRCGFAHRDEGYVYVGDGLDIPPHITVVAGL